MNKICHICALKKSSNCSDDQIVIKIKYKINIFKNSEDAPYAVLEIINKDVPFIIDSISNELKQKGFDIHLIAHPIVHLHRDKKGEFNRFEFNGDKEAVVQFHLSNKFDNKKSLNNFCSTGS